MRVVALWAALVAGMAGPGRAMVPEFAAPAKISASSNTVLDSYALPVGPFADGRIATETIEGNVQATAYQIDSKDLTTLQILAPLRDQIKGLGYDIRYECAAVDCGGYDFRFATRVVAEPDMHVDLADYRFLSATRAGPDGPEAISLMVSRSALLGFVQLIEVGASVAPEIAPTTAPVTAGITEAPEIAVPPLDEASLSVTLLAEGRVVLEDLDFDSGAAVLADADFPSLAALADWLKADVTRVIVLVGHTDASGGLAANVALGAKRADAIRDRLIQRYGVPEGQISAEGAGYLAPRASNLTEEGRRLNRRVEVVLLPPAE